MRNLETQIERPHNVAPHISSAHVVLAVKNFAAIPGACHIGLGVTASNTQKVLRRTGLQVEVWPAQTTKELRGLLSNHRKDPRPITHVIVSAPSWVQPDDFHTLALLYPETEFVQLNHSGSACLSIDKFGIKNIRAAADLQTTLHNFRLAGNNPRFVKWATETLGVDALLLPNLYDTSAYLNPITVRKDFDPLRIGSFGAGRPWKNQLTAAEAAVQMARRLNVDLELYVNSKRADGGERMIEARNELFANLPGCKLIEVPWAPRPQFRDICRRMDVLFSPSFDETFCVVVADGITAGTPSVVTGATEWTPRNWWCEPYDSTSIMTTAMGLLHDMPGTVTHAQDMLSAFVRQGTTLCENYLGATK